MGDKETQKTGDTARLHARVRGIVQGVGFRYFVLDRANALNLTGYVRNTFDDAVEVEAEGPRYALERLLADLQTGPRMASVEAVEAEWLPASGKFSAFIVARSF